VPRDGYGPELTGIPGLAELFGDAASGEDQPLTWTAPPLPDPVPDLGALLGAAAPAEPAAAVSPVPSAPPATVAPPRPGGAPGALSGGWSAPRRRIGRLGAPRTTAPTASRSALDTENESPSPPAFGPTPPSGPPGVVATPVDPDPDGDDEPDADEPDDAPPDLDADALYDRIRDRLRHDLLIDRERAALLTDLR
jgi:hypothetical protein